MMLSLRTLAACAIATTVSLAHADTPPTLEQALQTAAASRRPLVVEFFTTWCGPCRVFERDMLPDPRVQKLLQSVTFVRYDAEAEPGDDVAARFGVHAYPTFLVIDRSGVERLRFEGAPLGEPGIAKLGELVRDARAATIEEADVRASITAHPRDADVRLEAARWFAAHDKLADALAAYDAVATANAADVTRAEAWSAAARLRRLARAKQQLVGEHVERIRRFPAVATEDELAIATLGSGLEPAEIRSLFAIVVAKQTDVDALNATVYVALAAGALDEALYGATKVVKLRRDAQHVDTLAEVHHVRGEQAKAVALEDEAYFLARGGPLEAAVVANRKRFAIGKGEAREVKQLRLRAADLWKRTSSADVLAKRVAEPEDAAARQDMMRKRAETQRAFEAERKLEREIVATCTAQVGTVEQALVRIELDDAGHVTSTTQLHEPGATDALRRCIAMQVATATLPGPAAMRKRSLMLTFHR